MAKKAKTSSGRRRLAVCIAVAAAATAAGGIALAALGTGSGGLGTVNGLPFYAEELVVYADEQRAAVTAQISQQYDLPGTGPSFWDTEYDGVTPREVLLDTAMEDLVRSKVIQQECITRGIVAPADFRELEQAMEEENAARQSTAASGGVVYGTESYTLAQYNEYQMTMAIDELKEHLLKNELEPTEQQLRDAYDSLDESFKRKDFTCAGWSIAWPATADDEAAAALVAEALESTAPADLAAALADRLPGVTVEEFTFDSTEVHREDSTAIERSDILFFTEPGECSSILYNALPTVYYVTEKDGGGYYAFEESSRLGENKYINDAFEQFIDEKVAAATVEYSREKALEALRDLV